MRRWAQRAGVALTVIVACYLAVRAVVELVVVDPTAPATYDDAWGGPSYLGVLAVHCLPGLAGAGYLVWIVRHRDTRRRRKRPTKDQGRSSAR